MAPPGNQAANGENKLQPVAMEVLGLLDKGCVSKAYDLTTIEYVSLNVVFSCFDLGSPLDFSNCL